MVTCEVITDKITGKAITVFKNYNGVKQCVLYKLNYKAVVMKLIMITANSHILYDIFQNIYVHWIRQLQ